MAIPFEHAHVTHLVRMGRRRSQSVTLPKSDREETAGQSLERKQFLAQLRKERQNRQKKHDNEQTDGDEEDEHEHEPVVTRVPGANTIHSTRKQEISSPTSISENSTTPEIEAYRPTVTRVGRTPTTRSMRKNTLSKSSMSITTKKEMTSTVSKTIHTTEDEQSHIQINRIPRSESNMSFRKQMSTTAQKNSNVDLFTTHKMSNENKTITADGLYLDLSQTMSNPFQSSSTNLISKSEIFDQNFHLGDDKDHTRRNDTKSHGSINISGRGKQYNIHGGKLPASSSAGFMAAIIAIIIGVIAFAIGLAALILTLQIRSTVNNALGLNSTTLGSSSGSGSGGGGSLPSACSSYTTLDDPTRGVNAAGYALGCDNTLPFLNRTAPVWIRFIGTGGTTLPLTTPGMNICGTEGTGWYDGDMPSSSGQIVNGTACFTWYNSVCRFSVSISVANCDSFYIYLLPPAPACMMRYCTI